MNKPWTQGTIVQVGPNPKSYAIEDKDGRLYRRNRIHIREDTLIQTSVTHARNVEDLCPDASNDDPHQIDGTTDDQVSGDSSTQTVARRSTRTINRPTHYRDYY
ncbi:hypothetical protein AVEN_192117-1 [Araneus ventricosus]|uniref:Uncharacterized protein n=1 Tax=Araneus ventricosus TaxID=182803 RepID=A0A4Y2BA43_ARAVE|nr:hypothetical protein AVEN_192117-1 [Araneus ventricosus]